MYTILKELGSGASSNAFLVLDKEDNKKKVLKTPNMENRFSWLTECKNEIEITSKLSVIKSGDYTIPLSEIRDGKQMVSTLVEGEPLNKEMLDNMSADEKKAAAKSIASFLYDMHSISINQKNNTEFKDNTSAFFHNDNYKQTINKDLGLNIEKEMNDIFIEYNNDENIGKIEVTSHNDLIKDNILYNQSKKKLGIIDFGDVDKNDIYNDFAEIMRMGQLGDDFGLNVIKQYNAICKKNNTNRMIDPDTTKKHAILLSYRKVIKTNTPEKKLQFKNYLNEYREYKNNGMYRHNLINNKRYTIDR